MKNVQMIEIRYLAATNTKDARVKLVDTRFNISIIQNRDYYFDSIIEQAEAYLQDNGFNVVSKATNEITNVSYLFIDNFEPINESLAIK